MAEYFDVDHAREIASLAARFTARTEWPTWPALGLAMVRSLYEHRAARHPKARIAINEAGPLMRLLFLNNNYHLVHHDLPALPWFHLPHAYRMRREAYRRKCGGFVIGGYGALLRRYAWRPTDAPEHPFAGNAATLAAEREVRIGPPSRAAPTACCAAMRPNSPRGARWRCLRDANAARSFLLLKEVRSND